MSMTKQGQNPGVLVPSPMLFASHSATLCILHLAKSLLFFLKK